MDLDLHLAIHLDLDLDLYPDLYLHRGLHLHLNLHLTLHLDMQLQPQLYWLLMCICSCIWARMQWLGGRSSAAHFVTIEKCPAIKLSYSNLEHQHKTLLSLRTFFLSLSKAPPPCGP